MTDVNGKYWSNYDDVLIPACETVNDIKVHLAGIHKCLAPDVTLIDLFNNTPLLNLSEPAPPCVGIVLDHPEYESGMAAFALRCHAMANDTEGAMRVFARAEELLSPKVPIPALCAHALAQYLTTATVRKEVVDFLLGFRADVHFAHECGGVTCLHIAAGQADQDVVRALLEAKSEVNSEDDTGRSPLFDAAAAGNVEICRILCENAADIHHQSCLGTTALHLASMYGHCDVCEFLLQKNANVNCVDEAEWTPLLCAASEGAADVVNLLLRTYSANVNLSDKDGLSPLRQAALGGHTAVVKILLQDSWLRIDHKEVQFGTTALIAAAASGSLEIVNAILHKRADIHKTDNDGCNALCHAVRGNHLDIMHTLTKLGVKDYRGTTFEGTLRNWFGLGATKSVYVSDSNVI